MEIVVGKNEESKDKWYNKRVAREVSWAVGDNLTPIIFVFWRGKELLPMTVFEAMMMSISFSTLMVSIIALSFTFTKKK